MRQIMVIPSKRITLDVEPSVHLTGPDTFEANTPFPPHEVRLPMSVWDLVSAPPAFLESSGIQVVSVEDNDVMSAAAQFVGKNRMVITTPAKRLTLDLADSVSVLGGDTLEVDFCGDRTELTVWELLTYHAAGLGAFSESSGVQIVSVEDDRSS